MYTDFIMNGEGHGELGSSLEAMRFDTGLARPYFDTDGTKVCTVRTGKRIPLVRNNEIVRNEDGTTIMVDEKQKVRIRDLIANDVWSPVFNATTLSKDQWLTLDSRVIKAARARLRAWSDLRAANTYTIDGMSTSVLEHETITDDGEAIVDMEGMNEGRNDRSIYQLEGVPLPITHSSFWYSRRQFETSRKRGMPISFVRAEQAARRIAESIEKTLIGVQTGITYGNTALYGRAPTVYGYTNFPHRITKTNMTASASFVGKTFVDEVIAMRELAYTNNFFGPFIMYVSTAYDAKLDSDYKNSEASSTQTVRSRLLEIDGISAVRRLDYLTGDVVILVQMTSDVAEAINGMEMTTLQWESHGGQRLNFKVMAIQVPSLKATSDGKTGIIHGTTS